jgi:hypothetical protein
MSGLKSCKAKDTLPAMGQLVMVKAELRRWVDDTYDDEGRITKLKADVTWECRHLPERSWRVGWFMGARSLKQGVLDRFVDGRNELRTTSTIPCALVVYWPTQKPVKVPLEALDFDVGDRQPVSPMMESGADWRRRDLYERACSQDRGPNGRFK